MQLTKSYIPKHNETFNSSMLKIGEIMEITESGYRDQVYLRTFNGAVLIKEDEPPLCIDFPKPLFSGRKLNSGESISLTQK